MSRLALALTFVVGISLSAATHAQTAVLVNDPKDGAVVFKQQVEVSGIAIDSIRVAILIQGMTQEDLSWQVSSLVRPQADGRFQAAIPLRGEKQDVAYRILAVGAANTYALRTIRPGAILRGPPSGLPHSEVVRVTVAGSLRPDAGKDEAPQRILLPVGGSKIGPTETVVIEGSGEPTAVVLIRGDAEGSPWYAQPPVEKIGPGRTAVKVRFGSKKTIAGDRFRIRLAIPINRRQRAAIASNEPISKLPPGITYGQPLVVEFDPDKKPTLEFEKLKLQHAIDKHSHLVRILGPRDGSMVSRRASIAGFCDPTMVPILMVRSESEKTWYIQPPCETKAGSFHNRVYLGKLGTPRGTRFELVAVLVSPEIAGDFIAGAHMSELPTDVPLSEPLHLLHSGHNE